MKKIKGITLIALVITIIVLLILAGVTIASLSGDNGILTRAAEAKEKTRREDIQEQLNLWKTEKTMEENIGGNNMNISDFVAKLRDNKTITPEEFNEIETTYKLTIGRQEPIIFPNPELSLGAVIPDGCTYTTKAGTTYNSGENMPSIVMDGDKFITNDYTYEYHEKEKNNEWGKGWNVNKVSDMSKTKYEVLYERINGKPVTSMYETFGDISSGCTNLQEVPNIPQSVTHMNRTFCCCSNLIVAPVIPKNVISMCDTFRDCSSLITAPEIPEGVKDMHQTFLDCSSLITAPEIPDSVTEMRSIFMDCTSLKVAPKIPKGVTNISLTFAGCSNLTIPPVIPKNIEGMVYTFMGCSSLVNAPVIPENVYIISNIFEGCTSLKGDVIINSNLDQSDAWMYEGCFVNCAQDTEHAIVLKGTCSMLNELKNSGYNNGQFITIDQVN